MEDKYNLYKPRQTPSQICAEFIRKYQSGEIPVEEPRKPHEISLSTILGTIISVKGGLK